MWSVLTFVKFTSVFYLLLSDYTIYVCVCVSQVCVKENGNVQVDSDVALEIPPHTVIAYSLIELEVKKSGHYGECVCVCRVRPG